MGAQLQQTVYILIGVLAIAVAASLIRSYTVRSIASVNRVMAILVDTKLTFIGVIHHELSHAIMAAITGAKIVSIKLFKLSSLDGSLGSVAYRPRGPKLIRLIQHGFAGTAPVTCGMVTLALIYSNLIVWGDYTNWQMWLGVFLVMQITYHMTLSKSDIVSSVLGIPIICIIVYVVSGIVPIDIEIIVQFYLFIFKMLLLNFSLAFLIRLLFKK